MTVFADLKWFAFLVCSLYNSDINSIAPGKYLKTRRTAVVNIWTHVENRLWNCAVVFLFVTFAEHRWWSRRMDGRKAEAGWTLPCLGCWGIRPPSHFHCCSPFPPSRSGSCGLWVHECQNSSIYRRRKDSMSFLVRILDLRNCFSFDIFAVHVIVIWSEATFWYLTNQLNITLN